MLCYLCVSDVCTVLVWNVINVYLINVVFPAVILCRFIQNYVNNCKQTNGLDKLLVVLRTYFVFCDSFEIIIK